MSSFAPILPAFLHANHPTNCLRSTPFRRHGARWFFLRISSIRTVGNACTTDSHEVRCGADFRLRESYGAVRCGFSSSRILWCGAVWILVDFSSTIRHGAFLLLIILRCGAVRCRAVPCGFVQRKIVRWVKLNRTVRKNRAAKKPTYSKKASKNRSIRKSLESSTGQIPTKESKTDQYLPVPDYVTRFLRLTAETYDAITITLILLKRRGIKPKRCLLV